MTTLDILAEKVIRIEKRQISCMATAQGAVPGHRDANAGNAMSFTIGTEICDHLEKVVDRPEDIANEINSLVADHM